MKLKNLSNVGMIAALSGFLIATPSFASTRYTSVGGNLVVEYGNTCSTVSPSGSYRIRGGPSGDLVATDCENLGSDVSISRFTDTSGTDRCYGTMTHAWHQKVTTTWEVEGAVTGYACSEIGDRYEIEMDAGQRL